MTKTRPLTVSLPLGLFGSATMSVLEPNSIEHLSVPFPLDRELLDMPAIATGTDGLNDDIYWDDGSV